MENTASLHCIVSGRVQGVGYRWFVENTAKTIGLTGWVKNLPDGKVEIEAEGDKKTLESFLVDIKSGYTGAIVNDVTTQWRDAPQKKYKSFEISY